MKQNEYHIYLTWPRYLAQWYAHEMHRLEYKDESYEPDYRYNCDVPVLDLQPVKTRRGSLQRSILEANLCKPPEDFDERPPQDATICLVLPHTISKPPQYYHCLKQQGQALLEDSVRMLFRIRLGKYMSKMIGDIITTKQPSNKLNDIICGFMDLNGIEDTETNMIAIKQIWNRIINVENTKRWRESRKKG